MEQKYIKDSYNLDGNINLNKKLIGNVIDLARLSPTALRVFLLLCAYISRSNRVITDVASIGRLLGIEDLNKVKSALNTLQNNGYIEFSALQLDKSIDIHGVIHDRNLYSKSNEHKWEVVGTKLVTSYGVSGMFNLITVNEQFATADENGEDGSNLILHIKGRLFLDTSLSEDELNTFIYPDNHQ